QRLVARQLDQAAVVQVVGAAVADVTRDHVAAVHADDLGGAAHAAPLAARRPRRREHLLVGVLEGGLDQLLADLHVERGGGVALPVGDRLGRVGGEGRRGGQRGERLLADQVLPEHLDGQRGGHLAGLVAAHAVGQEDQGALAQVVLPDFAGVQQGEGVFV